MASTAGLATTTLVGCGSDDPADSTANTAAETTLSLTPLFPRGELYLAATTPQRMPFIVTAADGAPLDSMKGTLSVKISRDGTQVGDVITVTPRSSGLTKAYLAIPFTAPETGLYEIATEYQGQKLNTQVQMWPREQVKYPQIGETFPVAATPTVTDHRGVEPLCTRDPQCPFHEHSLDEVLAKGPVALLVSTPAYCQTAICGPLLDLLVDAAPEVPGLTYIHAEVYANPTQVASITEATSAPIIDSLHMLFEPALFLINSAGSLQQRFDSIFDATELREGLRSLS
jgi:hypothetical protein